MNVRTKDASPSGGEYIQIDLSKEEARELVAALPIGGPLYLMLTSTLGDVDEMDGSSDEGEG
jgi:hypothetical protein